MNPIQKVRHTIHSGFESCAKVIDHTKGLKELTGFLVSIIALVGKAYAAIPAALPAFSQILGSTRLIIYSFSAFERIEYWFSDKKKRWQVTAIAVFATVIQANSISRILEACNIKALSKVTAKIGWVPVIGLSLSLCYGFIGGFSLWNNILELDDKRQKLRQDLLQKNIWVLKNEALTELSSSQSHATILLNLQMKVSTLLAKEKGSKFKTHIETSLKDFVAGVEATKKAENLKDPLAKNITFFKEKVDYNIRKFDAKIVNDQLDKRKVILGIVQDIIELTLAVLGLIGLIACITALTSGIPILALAAFVAGSSLSKYIYNLKNPAKLWNKLEKMPGVIKADWESRHVPKEALKVV